MDQWAKIASQNGGKAQPTGSGTPQGSVPNQAGTPTPAAKPTSWSQVAQQPAAPTPDTTPAPVTVKSLFGSSAIKDKVGGVIKDYAGDVANTYKNAIGDFTAEAGKSDDSRSKNPIVHVAENALGATGSALNTVFAPITSAVKVASEKISNNKTVQGMVYHPDTGGGVVPKLLDFFGNASGKLDEWSKAHPEASSNLANILNVGSVAVGGEEAVKPGGVLEKGATATADAVNATKDAVVDTAKSAKDAVTKVAEKKVVDSTVKSWERPATGGKAISKAKDVLDESKKKGLDPARFLAEQKLDPKAHIEDGKYTTDNTADKLRSTAGKMSSDTLKPSLVAADPSIPKTPVADVLKKTIDDIKDDKTATPGDIETRISKARKEAAALERAHPDGLKLSELHDKNITYNQNGKFSPVGDTGVNNTASVNRSFGRSLDKLVQEKAPADLPVKAFKRYLQQYYNAADYLDTLNGKTAPVTLGQKISRAFAKGAGAAVGAHFGGLPTEFAGYTIGDALSHAAENVPNPFKKYFFDNLKQTNNPAFEKVKQFMGDKEASRFSTPALPAPKPFGTKDNPWTPPAPTTYEAPAEKITQHDTAPKQKLLEAPKNGRVSDEKVIRLGTRVPDEGIAKDVRKYSYNKKDKRYYLKRRN